MFFYVMSTEVGKSTQKRSPDLTSIYIIKGTRDKLRELKKELGFRSYDALLNHVALEIKAMGAVPPADYDLIFSKLETRPAIITGPSGSGKTSTVKELLSKWPGNVFALDTTGQDYHDLEQVDLGKFFGLKWGREGQRVRFCPNPNLEISRAEAATVFSDLNFVKNSGDLKDWVLLVDEAHRYSQDANLRALLIEARKFTRKFLLVSTDWRVYEGIARVFKPKPWGPPSAP
jgi:hypothetical protein